MDGWRSATRSNFGSYCRLPLNKQWDDSFRVEIFIRRMFPNKALGLSDLSFSQRCAFHNHNTSRYCQILRIAHNWMEDKLIWFSLEVVLYVFLIIFWFLRCLRCLFTGQSTLHSWFNKVYVLSHSHQFLLSKNTKQHVPIREANSSLKRLLCKLSKLDDTVVPPGWHMYKSTTQFAYN